MTAGSPSTPDSAAPAANRPACSIVESPSQGSASVRSARPRLNLAILLVWSAKLGANRRECSIEIVAQIRFDDRLHPRRSAPVARDPAVGRVSGWRKRGG